MTDFLDGTGLTRLWGAIKKFLVNDAATASIADGDFLLFADISDTESVNGSTISKLKRITWADIKAGIAAGSDSEQVVLLTGDAANATTNLADSGLSFSAEAGKTYLIEAFLIWDSSATTVGIKATMSASAAVTRFGGHFITDNQQGTPDSSSFNASDGVITTSYSPFTTACVGHISAILVNSSSANTIKLRFAAETTGTITLKAGTCLRYRKLN